MASLPRGLHKWQHPWLRRDQVSSAAAPALLRFRLHDVNNLEGRPLQLLLRVPCFRLCARNPSCFREGIARKLPGPTNAEQGGYATIHSCCAAQQGHLTLEAHLVGPTLLKARQASRCRFHTVGCLQSPRKAAKRHRSRGKV